MPEGRPAPSKGSLGYQLSTFSQVVLRFHCLEQASYTVDACREELLFQLCSMPEGKFRPIKLSGFTPSRTSLV
jgi:hypothetical protein